MILARWRKWHKARSMDKQERAKIIRERFKSKVGGFAFQKPSMAKPKRYIPTRTPFRFIYPMGFAGGPGYVGKWVVRPDDKPEPTVTTNHRTGVPALATIAEKVTAPKLNRRHAIAEGLLSERKQQSLP